MADAPRNRCRTSDLTDADVRGAVERIRAEDADLSRDAEHVFDSLTWGEGPGMIDQAGVQEWLWYVLPTKYVTDEVGYMGHMAESAARLFDELGLHGYATICRSEETAGVHASYDQSSPAGRTAFRKAVERSGIDAPDLDDFEWSAVMRIEEAQARSAVEAGLEDAVFSGRMTVGARGWRAVQAAVCAEVLDGDHPTIPGQSWRTAIVTERIEQWVSDAERRGPTLARARATIANRLLHPIEAPPSATEAIAPLTWLLDRWGDEQPLTQAGYLKPAFVQSLQADRPWIDSVPMHRAPKTELDDMSLHQLRCWLQRAGALRKHKSTLRRTPLGRSINTNASEAWTTLVRNLGGDGWDGFVAQTALLTLMAQPGPTDHDTVTAFVQTCAAEMGWRTTGDEGVAETPTQREVTWAFADIRSLWETCGLIDRGDDWRDQRLALTETGKIAALGHLRHTAAGPSDSM